MNRKTAVFPVADHRITIHADDANETVVGLQQLTGLGVNTYDALTAGVMDHDVAASRDVVADHRGQEGNGADGQKR